MSHVLFISHARGIHGAEAVMLQAIRACVAGGARVTVVVPSVVPDEGLGEALAQVDSLTLLALPYRAAGVHLLRTRAVQEYNVYALWRLMRFVQNEHVDTIYSSSSVAIIGAALSRMTHVHHVWHWHEPVSTLYGWHPSLVSTYRRWAQHTQTIICISQQQKNEWEQTLGVTLANATILYNPIKRIASISSDKSGHKDVRIGFIGHFEPRKNIPLLVRAFESLHTRYTNTSLWLCGAQSEDDKMYIAQMTNLREPDVLILPQTPDVASFYNNIDILVLPSWQETMPLVVFEAMQVGTCVLQTNRSGMQELLEDGKETYFFSPDQPRELCRLLEQCMNADNRQQIAQAGQRKALQLMKTQSFDQQIQNLLCE